MQVFQIGLGLRQDLLLQNAPDRKAQRVQVWKIWHSGWSWRCGPARNPAGRHSCHLDTSSRPKWPHAAAKGPDKPWRWLLYQCQRKLLKTFGCHCSPPPWRSASEEPWERERRRCWVLIGHRSVRKVAVVDGHIPGEDIFIGKNLDLMRLAGLQLTEEFPAPLLLHFLSVWGQKQPLDDHTALHTHLLLYQVPHCPWIHAMLSCNLPHAVLRIFSHGHPHGDGSSSPDQLLLSSPLAAVSGPGLHLGALLPWKPGSYWPPGPCKSWCSAGLYRTSDRWVGGRCDPWRLRPPTLLYSYHSQDCSQLDCAIFAALGPLTRAAADRQKAVHDWSIHPVYKTLRSQAVIPAFSILYIYVCIYQKRRGVIILVKRGVSLIETKITATLLIYESMTLWCLDTTSPWLHDSVHLWLPDSLIPWLNRCWWQ